MKKKSYFIVLLCFSLFYMSCKNKKNNETKSQIDTIVIHDFNSLEPLLNTDSEKIHIVNFWAMWCVPCVKELPIIEAFTKNNPDSEILLVSLDFPEDIETKLKPFLKKRNISSEVVLLDDPDVNTWINKIDPNWSGAIPFTIIFNNKNRSFHERAFKDLEDLENEINNTINK